MASNKDKGWIKLSRGLLESAVWSSPEPFTLRDAWIDILLMVNFEDKEIMTRHGDVIKVPRGATFTSIQHLADRWHWSPNKVRRQTEKLKKLGMIDLNGTADGTLLSVVKYRDFQDGRRADGTTGGTSGGTTGGTRLKNIKNEKKEKRRTGAPVSMEETIEALKKWAAKGEEEI